MEIIQDLREAFLALWKPSAKPHCHCPVMTSSTASMFHKDSDEGMSRLQTCKKMFASALAARGDILDQPMKCHVTWLEAGTKQPDCCWKSIFQSNRPYKSFFAIRSGQALLEMLSLYWRWSAVGDAAKKMVRW